MQQTKIKQITAILESNIPTSASIIGEVIRAIHDPSSCANDIASIIERDPTITAIILRVSNSAYYGSSAPINSLKRAVVIMGFKAVKEFVTTIALINNFFDPKTQTGFNRIGLWKHSVATARAAQFIAKKTNIVQEDVAYTIGLLHDIGKVMLSISFPEKYTDVILEAEKNKEYVVEAERRIFGFDHCFVGKIVCDKWNLHQDIITAIISHNNLVSKEKLPLPIESLIRLADVMSRRANIGNPGDYKVPNPRMLDLRILAKSVSKRLIIFGSLLYELKGQEKDIDEFFLKIS